MTTKSTGLIDRNGAEIMDGDLVSLDGNMTADNSFSWLPNGWMFDETDVYEVYLDSRINNWSLKLGVDPDSPLNIKFMNHAVSLLHSGDVTIVDPTTTKPAEAGSEGQGD